MKTIEHIRIPSGPQFRNPLAILLFFILLILIFSGITTLLTGAILFFLLQSLVLILVLSLILDFRGIEINRERMMIRSYRQLLWFRYGKWIPLQQYVSLRLQVDFAIQGASPKACGKSPTSAYYDVVLVHFNKKNNLVLKEFTSYNKALVFMEMYARWLNLPSSDYVAEKRISRFKS